MPRQIVRFAGMRRPVIFADCPEIPLALQEIAPSWHFHEDSDSSCEPAIFLRKWKGEYGIGVPWRETPWFADTLVGAVCSFAVDLIESHLMDNPGLLGLHGAAAGFRQGLVLFPAERRAGKSTLAARLLMDGIRIYSDDLIALDRENRAMAYGVPPRLRLPLPDTAGPALHEFVGEIGGARDAAYLYISPNLPNLAGYGETAPLSAIVLLDHRPGGAASLESLPESEGLHYLATQYLAREASTDDVLQRCRKMTLELPTYRLCYSCLEEASLCLREHFDRQQNRASPTVPPGEAHPRFAGPGNPDGLPPFLRVEDEWDGPELDPTRHYVQIDGIKVQRVDSDLFLSHGLEGSIHRLNPIGASLWGLLAVPTSLTDALETFRTAFPEVGPAQLEKDLRHIFRELLAESLIRPAG